MDIAVISNLFPPHVVGGYELGCLSLARAASSAGHNVRVLTSASIGRLRKRDDVKDLMVRTIFKPIYNYETFLSGVPCPEDPNAFGGIDAANVLALYNELDRQPPDVIWIFNPMGLGPVGIFETAVASGIPATAHLMDHLDQIVTGHQRGFHVLSRWVRAKSRMGAIACSRKTLSLNELCGSYQRSIVIPNGIRMDTPPAVGSSTVGSKYNIVYFGQVERHKGILELAESFARARRTLGDSIELHIIGSGSAHFRDELGCAIRRLRIEGAVVQHGFIEAVPLREKLKEMHLAVFPLSAQEPFAYVVIEAMHAGLPTIVTREAGCAEFLPSDYPFLLARQDDVTGLNRLICQACLHREDALEWQRRVRMSVLEQFDLDRNVLPKCLRFLAEGPRHRAEGFSRRVFDSLSSWQSNRHCQGVPDGTYPKVAVGKRIERWVKRQLPNHLRLRVKNTFKQFFQRRAA